MSPGQWRINRSMVDYQFLAMVAVVALVMMGSELVARRYRRRQAGPPPSDSELTRWMTVMDRMLRSPD
jgi:hypothetical protein